MTHKLEKMEHVDHKGEKKMHATAVFGLLKLFSALLSTNLTCLILG